MIDYAGRFKKLVEAEGYELLGEYKGSITKVKIRCKKGHAYSVTPDSFKSGYRCPICAGLCSIQAKEQFIELLDEVGYKLLSEYKGSKIKVNIRCNKGHEYRVTPDNFKSGKRCPECPIIKVKKEFIELIESVGYELLSEYKNITTKVLIRCKKGHEYNVTPNNFKQGNRCPYCPSKYSIKTKKEFIEYLANVKYELLGEYNNNSTKVKIRCNKGHDYSVSPSNFKKGRRCPICAGLCSIQAEKNFKELLVKERYTLIGKYKNNKTKVLVMCPEGHEWNVIPSGFKNYCRCPHCEGSTGQRLLQKKLKEHIKEDVIYNDRKILEGLELDIYYPELSIGIEYQGNYWHTRPKTIVRDKRKKLLCKEKGIKLIEVWDDDFLKNQEKELYKIIGVINGSYLST